MKRGKNLQINSSSSSFVIAKRHLDSDQIEAIRRHDELGGQLGIKYSEDAWCIEENKNYIGGYTCMDNFDMEEFLDKIDVDMRRVDWSDSYVFELPGGCNDWRSLL